jgi:hypothetical protein
MGLMQLLFGKTIDRRIAEYQKELIAKHCDEVQNIYQTMRGWRHDYHNHIQTLLALSGNEAKTREYLLKLNDDLTQVDTVLKTGNVMVDAILNSKLSLIRSKEIRVNAKAVVPTELNVSEIDLCVIIGNLLDNAMEACLRQAEEKERFIRVFIGVLKEQLYISVSNSVEGGIKKSDKAYFSGKGSEAHGFGLASIDRIAAKYDGRGGGVRHRGPAAALSPLVQNIIPFVREIPITTALYGRIATRGGKREKGKSQKSFAEEAELYPLAESRILFQNPSPVQQQSDIYGCRGNTVQRSCGVPVHVYPEADSRPACLQRCLCRNCHYYRRNICRPAVKRPYKQRNRRTEAAL